MIRLTIVLLLLYSFVSAGQIRVGPNLPVESIKSAIAMARPGDTVFVEQGIYREHDIEIHIPLTLTGINRPVIDADGQGFIFRVFADNVTIRGFKLINVPVSYIRENAAVYTSKIDTFLFEDLHLENIFFGFHIEKSHNGIIRNNRISSNGVAEISSGNGIHLWYSNRIRLENNQISGMRDGIYLEFSNNSIINGNESRHNIRYGLHFMFSNDDRYEKNLFEQNGAGVAVMFSKKIYMKQNTFRLNWGAAAYGLLLKEITDLEVIENTFDQNTIGINADGSNRVHYERNTFSGNGWAVRFIGACYGNKFIGNNFLNNALEISYKGSINGNFFDRNYWSSYAGYDLNRDGIGDVPYRPVKLFSYIVNETPETIVLLRSLFVDLINFSEKVSPVFTPDNLKDENPMMVPAAMITEMTNENRMRK